MKPPARLSAGGFTIYWGFLSVAGGAGEEAGDPEEDDGTYDGGYEVADYSGCGYAEEAEEPAAEYAPDYAYDKIDDPSETAAAH